MRFGRGDCRSGLTMVEFLIVVAVIVMIGVLLFPAMAPSHRGSPRIHCVNNLKQIGLSFTTWALDNGDRFPMQVSLTNGGTMELANGNDAFVHFRVMSNELSTPKILICPSDTAHNTAATTF